MKKHKLPKLVRVLVGLTVGLLGAVWLALGNIINYCKRDRNDSH